MTPLRKWYFGVDERGARNVPALLRAAVVSCRTHTTLEPHLLYHGEEVPFLDELRALGVTVHHHTPSIAQELKFGYGPEKYEQFVGHWLRLDIPDIEQDEDVVLYTDIDVIFATLPAVLPRPRLIAAGPAEEREERGRFNSGVMLMNLPALREVWPDFMASVRDRLLNDFRYPAHDQVSFNRFFREHIEWIADDMNWRPYWGLNPSAHIVHFHGPKPPQVRRMMRGHRTGPERKDARIWSRDPDAYAFYVDRFDRYVADIPPERESVAPTMIEAPTAEGLVGRLSRLFAR